MKKFLSKGFTLIELMIAVSIMAILFAIAVSFYSNVVQKSARDAKKRADIDAIAKVYETNFPKENKYIALTNDDFTNKVIPTPPEGGSYQCVAGPDTAGCKLLTGEGFKVCATLADSTLYCRSSTQGGLASSVNLATFFGSAPKFIGISPISTFISDGVTSFTISKPGITIKEGDLLLAHIAGLYSNQLSASSLTWNDPTGWTMIGPALFRPHFTNSACSQHLRSATYWRRATASEPLLYSWATTTSNISFGGAIVVYEGVNTTNPIHVADGRTTAENMPELSVSTPTVNITLHNTTIVTFFANCGNFAWSPPAGMVERYDYGQAGFFPSISGDAVEQSAPASVFKTATFTSPFPGYGTAQIVVLKP